MRKLSFLLSRTFPVAVGLCAAACGANGLATGSAGDPEGERLNSALAGGAEMGYVDDDTADKNRAAGLGTLEIKGRRGMLLQLSHLDLASVDIGVELAGDMAETRVEESFSNPTDTILEGTFRFPLPDGAELTGLAMEIDGKMVEGSLTEREKAEKAYQDVVDKMLDPAILTWEPGNVFKLRVFPIEPQKEKKIVIRYLAPLRHSQTGSGESWKYVYPTAAAEMQQAIPHFRLVFDGRVEADETDFKPGKDLVVSVTTPPPQVLTETRPDGTYTAVRIHPDWQALSAPATQRTAREVVILVDSSRSALESRPLAIDSLRAIAGELSSADKFAVLACDLSCTKLDWAPGGPSSVDAAVKLVSDLDFDGASDLGAMFDAAGKLGGNQVIYLGDGIATWGTTDADPLRTQVQSALAGKPFFAVAMGKGAHTEFLNEISAVTGGKMIHPTELFEVERFARFVARAPEVPHLAEVTLAVAGAASIYPDEPFTIYQGDDVVALVRTNAGDPAPVSVVVDATMGGNPVHQTIALAGATPAPHVAARWARARINELESMPGDQGAEIVKTSLDYGVMSHKTVFLVLESDEMWKKYQLERKEAEAQASLADPHVTGGDLESIDGNRARLSPDNIQPGDPEVRVPAPPDAREVEVIFPFGETKLATFEPEIGAWTVRFLIDQATPDGKYDVTVRITYADGHVETLTLPYTVDTHAPSVTVTMTEVAPGDYRIDAVQETGDPAGLDARVVEVAVPGGEVVWLNSVGPGKFSGHWKTDRHVAAAVDLRVVAEDRAQNENAVVFHVEVAQ